MGIMDEIVNKLPEKEKEIFLEVQVAGMRILNGDPTLKITSWGEFRFMCGFFAQTSEFACKQMEIKENSVFINTFTKTGTTWCTEVVRQILYGENEIEDAFSKALSPAFNYLEMGSENKFKLFDYFPLHRRIYMSHLSAKLFDLQRVKDKNGKVIVMIRNPKDQAVSLFHFMQTQVYNGIRDMISADWSEFFESYVKGNFPLGTRRGEWYPDFILSYCQYRDDEDVLFVHYEDMKRDLRNEISRIAEFLNVTISNERIQNIAMSTSFEAMKLASSASADNEVMKLKAKVNMLRKGVVGNWKEHFTVAQSELMDKLIDQKLRHTDIKFTYEL